jgi:uncharacterized protein YndB with AHSA1/START domain
MSTRDGLLPAVRHDVVVRTSPERAFEIFTADIGTWWPKTHTILSAPVAEVVFEPRVGGRVYDRGVDGTIGEWSRVLEFTPPRRIVLAWLLDGEWRYDPDLDHASRVTVGFAPDGEGTRVSLVHEEFERHGAGAASVAGGVDGPNGWPGLLPLFAAAADRA